MIKLFRTEEVLASLKLLRDLGKICIDKNLVMVLIDKTSGEEYDGSLAQDSNQKVISKKVVPKQEPGSEQRSVQRNDTQATDEGQASLLSNIPQHNVQVNVPSVTCVKAAGNLEKCPPNFSLTDPVRLIDS